MATIYMLSIEDIRQIADDNSYQWIRINKFVADEVPCEQALATLQDHHIKETTFLLDKCRNLAKIILAKEDIY